MDFSDEWPFIVYYYYLCCSTMMSSSLGLLELESHFAFGMHSSSKRQRFDDFLFLWLSGGWV